jgi:hypothetical protein
MEGSAVEPESYFYDWERFWVPRDEAIVLTPRGYLLDPGSEFAEFSRSKSVPFGDIAGCPCLALLGEPGMGKTSALQAARRSIDEQIIVEGHDSLWLRLRSYNSDTRLVADTFGSSKFANWLMGEHLLHVFLDDFDECHLRIETLASLLVDELHKYPIDAIRKRLRLRIACRTAAWPPSLEEGLRQLWSNDSFAAYELAPLREIDVASAAETRGLAPDSFLTAVDRADAAPLASRPITLDFLLESYSRTGVLSGNRVSLYTQGCELLCRELNRDRRDARRVGSYSPRARLEVAGRIAAVTVFAGRYAIQDTAPSVASDDVLSVEDLAGGSELVNGEALKVGEDAIRDTLNTALFSGRGAEAVGWAHQALAEFLATRYLVQRDASLPQLMSLIVYPGDGESKVTPQLRDAASWLAEMRPDVFHELLKSDPEVLLLADLVSVQEDDRAALVGALLDGYDQGRIVDKDWALHRRFDKLNHSGLSAQLRTYIVDPSKSEAGRRVAVDIAETCELRELQDDLVDIALDPDQELQVRINAGYAVLRVGDEKTKGRLKPLITAPAEEDPLEELKGCGLRACWPSSLTAEELFAVLAPSRTDLYGAYRSFLYANPALQLRPADLPIALDWVASLVKEQEVPFELDDIVVTIMRSGWDNLDLPGVIGSFARASVARMLRHEEILGGRIDSESRVLICDDDRRRRVLAAVLPIASELVRTPWILRAHGLLECQDVAWLLQSMESERSPNMIRVWALIIREVLAACPEVDSSPVWSLREADLALREVSSVLAGQIPVLRDVFATQFDPVPLDSPMAKRMRTDYQRHKAMLQRMEETDFEREPFEPPIHKVLNSLARFENGKLAAWWQLNLELLQSPDGRIANIHEPNLTTSPTWQEADADTRQRILTAAVRYVREQTPEPEKWVAVGTGTEVIVCHPDSAGYRALELLLHEQPDRLPMLAPEVWQRWAPVIVAYRHRTNGDDDTAQRVLIGLAYQHGSDEVISTLLRLLDRQCESGAGIDEVLRKASHCWDDRFEEALLEKTRDAAVPPEAVGALLCQLLDRRVHEARAYAEELIRRLEDVEAADRTRSFHAGRALALHTDDAGWNVLWPAIQADHDFGDELLMHVSWRDIRGEQIFPKLSEQQLADLYVWLSRRYPHADDPKPIGAHTVSLRENIGHWRDSALSNLQRRGTRDAISALRRIAAELPHLEWMTRVIHVAQDVTRRTTWAWPSPRHVLALAMSPDRRLVQNADQLLDTVVESLQRLEEKLQRAESPAAVDLWSVVGSTAGHSIVNMVLANLRKALGKEHHELTIKGYRDTFGADASYIATPKEENLLSDYVKRHLDDDLRGRDIVVNREVQNRRRNITDIRVDAIKRAEDGETSDVLTVIVEVKGCWHPALRTAMQSQLAARYLEPAGIDHGLFLVGWFNCDQWSSADPRKADAPRMTLEEASRQFEAQAQSLSVRGLRVRSFVLDASLRVAAEQLERLPESEMSSSPHLGNSKRTVI